MNITFTPKWDFLWQSTISDIKKYTYKEIKFSLPENFYSNLVLNGTFIDEWLLQPVEKEKTNCL